MIVRDLKKNNEPKWKGWTIEVKEGDREVWQIPITAQRRRLVQTCCEISPMNLIPYSPC
jgi:hypothetical protein